MRKGFSLIELIVIVIILPVVILVIAGLHNTFFLEIPKTYKVMQENTTLLNLLEKFQQDIDMAKELPESFGGNTAGDKLILIGQNDYVVCYKIEDDRVLRYELTNSNDTIGRNEEQWPLPKTNIRWNLLRRDDRNYAVEIETYIEYNVHGRFEKKLANSHLYYIDAF